MGGLEILIVLFAIGLPMAILSRIAQARGQSLWYIAWGLLSFVGLLIGILMMLAMPRPQRPNVF